MAAIITTPSVVSSTTTVASVEEIVPPYVQREQRSMDRLTGANGGGGLTQEERRMLSTMPSSTIGTSDAMPNTAASLLADFQRLGLQPGMNVIVHSSMSKLGWCVAAPDGVCYALLAAVGAITKPDGKTSSTSGDAPATVSEADSKERDMSKVGTIMMPAHSSGNTDPKIWHYPPAPLQWHSTIRRHMSPFDPLTTPSRSMGNIAECFRTLPGAHRSYHPECSFSAIGRHAAAIAATHSLSFCLGEKSPVATLYQLDGYVLLLGVGHANNTSIHYAESKTKWATTHITQRGSAVLPDRVFPDEDPITAASDPVATSDTWPLPASRWVTYRDIDYSDDDFEEIGAAFTAAHPTCVRTGMVGAAIAILVQQRPLIDFAVTWIDTHRKHDDA